VAADPATMERLLPGFAEATAFPDMPERKV